MAVLRGNLAPGGAVIKHGATTPAPLQRTSRVVVFDDTARMAARIDDPALDVPPKDVLVEINPCAVTCSSQPWLGNFQLTPSRLLSQCTAFPRNRSMRAPPPSACTVEFPLAQIVSTLFRWRVEGDDGERLQIGIMLLFCSVQPHRPNSSHQERQRVRQVAPRERFQQPWMVTMTLGE
jgi:hypothetical protein